MTKKQIDLQNIYLNQMAEVRDSLNAAQHFIGLFLKTDNRIEFDCGVLQLRKALEATAYASIAPNKEAYRAFRQKGKMAQDFTKDFNATKIFQYLRQTNKDFYPMPLKPSVRQPDGTVHFEENENSFLTKKKFIKIYDRLGKFLHADNPWGTNKQRQNLAKDIPAIILELRELLILHATFIRTKKCSEVWIVELPLNHEKPKITIAIASGDFAIK